MVYPRLQTPQGEPVAKTEILLLIIPILVFKSDIKEAHRNYPSPFFQKENP